MPDELKKQSFSPASRWKTGFDVVLRTALVLAVVAMVNYIGAQFFHRFYLSSQTRVMLSSRTMSVLHSLTNDVAVTLYYDRKDDFYPDIVALLNEYHAGNPRISIRTVDYVRDAGAAEKIKEQYQLNSAADKNLIIFDAGNEHFLIRSGDALVQYGTKGMTKDRKLEIGVVAFNGELMLTSTLLALENPKPFTAYFLQADGEGSLADTGDFGFLILGSLLGQNYISVTNLELLGGGGVPMDCDLLIIAAPTKPFSEPELQKIDQYLAQGGRLLALFNFASVKQPTGLEPILQRWGVIIGDDYVKDPGSTVTGDDVIVRKFSQHPVVNSLSQDSLQMVRPRPVGGVDWKNPPPDAPKVDVLAVSSPESVLENDPSVPPRSYPLIVAVEQKPVAGVASPRGNARLIVAGDSIFLGNHYIEGGANRDFLNNAANWLIDRPQLTGGIGPRPVIEYRLLLTQTQRREILGLLLGALPGVILVFGWLVWLVRRK
jgi:hypothetical protein